MAASKRILCLSLGSQVVRIAEFRADQKGGLVLIDYKSSELLADPATDGTRMGQTSIAVQELAGALKATGATVNYSIPAQSVFTRFVKLPSVGVEKLEKIIAFEAQQKVPFPLDEVVWDSQVVSPKEASEYEVALVAIKSDLLDELNGTVEGAKLTTGIVDVAPMALYNAFRFNYSDVGGCSLIIDIGSRSTNLLFVEPNKVFTRSIPIGGNTITAAIAKDFAEPFSQAEDRKKACGFVSLGGAYADPEDQDVARVSKVVRNTMTRLHAEISRSITHYRQQQGGSAPDRVYLCGGAVSMPYVTEFFNEKLSLPVEFFNPLRNVAVSDSLDSASIGKDSHLLGDLVGLGLRSNGACPMELTLLPEHVVAAQAMAKRRPFLIGAAVCLFATLGAWGYYLGNAADAYTVASAELKPKINALNEFNRKFETVRKEAAAEEQRVAPLLQLVNDREYWVRLVTDLNKYLPARNIWITDLQMAVAGSTPNSTTARSGNKRQPRTEDAIKVPSLLIKGQFIGERSVARDYFDNLVASEFFNLDKDKMNEFLTSVGAESSAYWTADYELRLPLKTPIAK